jgi:hypothetical protein
VGTPGRTRDWPDFGLREDSTCACSHLLVKAGNRESAGNNLLPPSLQKLPRTYRRVCSSATLAWACGGWCGEAPRSPAEGAGSHSESVGRPDILCCASFAMLFSSIPRSTALFSSPRVLFSSHSVKQGGCKTYHDFMISKQDSVKTIVAWWLDLGTSPSTIS